MSDTGQCNSRRRVFVFSDWHLGGDPDDLTQGRVGTQICRSAGQITSFIDWVGAEAAAFSGTTEIVINGDMVDFLAPIRSSRRPNGSPTKPRRSAGLIALSRGRAARPDEDRSRRSGIFWADPRPSSQFLWEITTSSYRFRWCVSIWRNC